MPRIKRLSSTLSMTRRRPPASPSASASPSPAPSSSSAASSPSRGPTAAPADLSAAYAAALSLSAAAAAETEVLRTARALAQEDLASAAPAAASAAPQTGATSGAGASGSIFFPCTASQKHADAEEARQVSRRNSSAPPPDKEHHRHQHNHHHHRQFPYHRSGSHQPARRRWRRAVAGDKDRDRAVGDGVLRDGAGHAAADDASLPAARAGARRARHYGLSSHSHHQSTGERDESSAGIPFFAERHGRPPANAHTPRVRTTPVMSVGGPVRHARARREASFAAHASARDRAEYGEDEGAPGVVVIGRGASGGARGDFVSHGAAHSGSPATGEPQVCVGANERGRPAVWSDPEGRVRGVSRAIVQRRDRAEARVLAQAAADLEREVLAVEKRAQIRRLVAEDAAFLEGTAERLRTVLGTVEARYQAIEKYYETGRDYARAMGDFYQITPEECRNWSRKPASGSSGNGSTARVPRGATTTAVVPGVGATRPPKTPGLVERKVAALEASDHSSASSSSTPSASTPSVSPAKSTGEGTDRGSPSRPDVAISSPKTSAVSSSSERSLPSVADPSETKEDEATLDDALESLPEKKLSKGALQGKAVAEVETSTPRKIALR